MPDIRVTIQPQQEVNVVLDETNSLRVGIGETLDWSHISNIPNLVNSIFGRTGIVVAETGDYSTLEVTENTNLYFTDSRAVTALTGQPISIFDNDAGFITVDDIPTVPVLSVAGRTGDVTLTKADVGLDNVLNVAQEPAISSGSSSQYWRGDKTWQTLDKNAVGLSNVENTALSTWAGSTNISTLGTIIGNITRINDANGNSMIAFTATGSAVDGFTFTNAAAGSPAIVKISGTGSDSNISVSIQPKGSTGAIILGGDSGSTKITLNGLADINGSWRFNTGTGSFSPLASSSGFSLGTSALPWGGLWLAGDIALASGGIISGGTSNTARIQLYSGFGSSSASGILFYTYNSGAATARYYTAPSGNQYFSIGTAGMLGFESAGNVISGNEPDTAIKRNAAGVVEINNATSGTYRDLKLRTLLPGGGMTQTVSTPMIDASQTWNASGVTFTGLKSNITDTASAAASLLLDLQVNDVSKITIDKAGHLKFMQGAYQCGIRSIPNVSMYFQSNSIDTLRVSIDHIPQVGLLQTTHAFGWSDVILYRDGAANTLALRNSTAAQVFNIYNTYTDASNYERGFVRWEGNALQIGTGKSGTGTARELVLTTDFTSRWRILTNGHLLATADNTYDIGASGGTRPRIGYFGTGVTTATGTFTNSIICPFWQLNSAGSFAFSSDGVWIWRNNAGNDFGRLQLGGTTSGFPAIKRNGAGIDFRVADDTAYAAITASQIIFPAGTATVAPIRLTAGTNLITPINGAMEFDGTHLYVTISGVRYQIDQQSGGSGVVDGQQLFDDSHVLALDAGTRQLSDDTNIVLDWSNGIIGHQDWDLSDTNLTLPAMTIQFRRGTQAELAIITPEEGEPCYTTDTKKLYIGDGATAGGVLVAGNPNYVLIDSDDADGELAVGNQYVADTTSASFTMLLPASPTVGDVIKIADAQSTWDTNVLTIDPNGNNLDGAGTEVDFDISNTDCILVYVGGVKGWNIYA